MTFYESIKINCVVLALWEIHSDLASIIYRSFQPVNKSANRLRGTSKSPLPDSDINAAGYLLT
jgi:hypothetical protein